MSQENVELALLTNDAWNRRDVDAVVALWDPNGVWNPALERDMEGRRTYRGHAGVRQYFEDLAEFSEESHAERGGACTPINRRDAPCTTRGGE